MRFHFGLNRPIVIFAGLGRWGSGFGCTLGRAERPMLDNAVRICDANGSVGICRWDGDALHHVVHRQARPAFAEVMKRTPIYPDPKTNVGRMLVTKTVVHVPDLAAQPAYTA